jgi:hypothetical protein
MGLIPPMRPMDCISPIGPIRISPCAHSVFDALTGHGAPTSHFSLITSHLSLISRREYFANIAVYSQRRENFSFSKVIVGRESGQKLVALSSNCLLATTTMVGASPEAAEDSLLAFAAMS